jgi:hypothetical protein
MTLTRIFLDSGAFTAARQGEAIDVREYTKFARRNLSLLHQVVNLDLIPDPLMDNDEIEDVCAKSYKNQQTLRDAGLSPLPVVHRLDAPIWLERYLEDGEPYIALAPGRQAGAVGWLRRCFKTIAQASYKPKVHGLGVTNSIQLVNFPWSSVDSATWIKQAAVGRLLVPLFDGDDRPLYHLRPDGVFVTDRMRVETNHIDRLNDFQRDDLCRFLQSCSLSLSEVRHSHEARCRALIAYFRALQPVSGAALYFVSNPQARSLLAQCGAYDHLLSYARLRGQRDGALERYVSGTVRSCHTPV